MKVKSYYLQNHRHQTALHQKGGVKFPVYHDLHK